MKKKVVVLMAVIVIMTGCNAKTISEKTIEGIRPSIDSLTERKGYLKAINDISTQLVKFNIGKAVDSVLKIKNPEQRERARFYLAGKLEGFHCVIKILDSLNK